MSGPALSASPTLNENENSTSVHLDDDSRALLSTLRPNLALELCKATYKLISFGITPRLWQLEANISFLGGKDTIVVAGTGAGKTMAIILPLLARPNLITLTISPLTTLMDAQVCSLLFEYCNCTEPTQRQQ